MRQYIFVTVICFFLSADVIGQTVSEGRRNISFNSGWLFSKGTENAVTPDKTSLGWQAVQLPHTWNDKDVLADGERGYYRGIGWYKKNFHFYPEEGKKYFLRFEGVNQIAEVFVNGQPAGKHIG